MSKVVKAKYTAEAVAGFTHRTAMEEAARCLLCHDAPCSQGCPAGTDPAKFIRSIRFRNVKGAAETIRENNILGGSCARVCPYDRLCEEACSRCGIDKPIQIGKLQRYAIEQEKVFKMKILKAPAKKKAAKVACVGAGPASLAAAAELAKAGYRVTIFEREEKAGGVLTYGIVPSRLPQAVVDHDIAQVKGLGVKFEFGKEVKAADLEEYDAVFVGTGLWGANLPKIEGIELAGVYSAVDFLKAARTQKNAFDPGKKVLVVGGGDVAVDCAVTAKLLGAEDVKIVYRRTLEEAPGNMTEFQYALTLGIGITTGMAPAAIKGADKVEAVEFKGFRDEAAQLVLSADTIVFATGQTAEDQTAVAPVKVADKGLIKAPKGKAGGKFFAAGDIVNGGKTVVEAVAAGKEAADAMIAYLEKKGVK
ncbi:MAG: FAD-dependent oxidoreductase [Firmicutes bacterium]|nr:FAD-dependent oxidoreductase [Bacillota bacterium]MBQ3185370.1 FAD-dependent oxidoreductase [Bacillota bacterium]MBQ3610839.1 FAD-dependent oxidoreductase [Bacillota bacterium]MBR1993338.1 FAD-dependent oxidoreductase [Bacillota bacterium]